MNGKIHRAALVLVALMATQFAVAGGAEPGQPAPPLVVKQFDGGKLDMAELRGKVVIVHFWATWCTSCRAEMPVLDTFYQKHLSDGVALVGLSLDDAHDRRDAVKMMNAFKFPAALLSEAQTNGFGTPKSLPLTYVVDAQGIVRARLVPAHAPLQDQDLERVVLPLLSIAPLPAASSLSAEGPG